MTDITVAILAGGTSKRFGSEKALAEFQGKPLISHMLNIASQVSTEVLVVVSNEDLHRRLRDFVPSRNIVSDPENQPRCALTGALTAFQFSKTYYTLLLPVDAPLSHPYLLNRLIYLSPGHDAVVPSWPSGFIEPLHAVYAANEVNEIGTSLIEDGKLRMSEFLGQLHDVLYVSTDTLSQYDSSLDSFTNFLMPC